MPVKIRLQRRGKKGKPYFWIIAADSRSKRDGKFLEKIGFYNPTTNPAQIDLDVDCAVKWLQNGAQPTDTARAILSYKGALMKNHLAGGVRKGALTEEQAETKFNEWLETKKGAIDHKAATLSDAKAKAKAEALAAEKAVNEKRAADAAAAAAPAEEEATEEVEATAETANEEAPAAEAKAEETAEAPAKEAKEEKAEAKEEAPKAAKEEE
jgi:small subunit ribosomal protein S16